MPVAVPFSLQPSWVAFPSLRASPSFSGAAPSPPFSAASAAQRALSRLSPGPLLQRMLPVTRWAPLAAAAALPAVTIVCQCSVVSATRAEEDRHTRAGIDIVCPASSVICSTSSSGLIGVLADLCLKNILQAFGDLCRAVVHPHTAGSILCRCRQEMLICCIGA